MERVTSMDEVRATKVVKGEGCQESKDGVQVIEERQSLSISISTPGSSSIDEKFKTLKQASDKEDCQSLPKIQRAPFMLRDHKDSEKDYEPRVVAIGPLHHGKCRLQFAEKTKLKLANQFLIENDLVPEVEYNKIKTEIQKLRKRYHETEIIKFDDEDLAWMLFVDGCAVLHFIRCFVRENQPNEKNPNNQKQQDKLLLRLNDLKIKDDHVAFATQDLFLLENQLPYEVLNLLMPPTPTNCPPNSEAPSPDNYKQSIEEFIDFILRRSKRKNKPSDWTEPTHLLDLLRTKMLGVGQSESAKRRDRKQSLINHSSDQPNGGKRTLGTRNPCRKQHETTDTSFRNVKELKAVGINLEVSSPSDTNLELSSSIKFHSRFCGAFGILALPRLTVDDSTEPRLKNLVAYEMCPDFFNDFGVTSYVCFIDSLIDEAADVKEMREAGTLRNVLGSDEEVAELFNRISKDLVPNPRTYKDVKAEIQSHYDNVVKTWIAQGIHDHFSSPWTFLAFFGAIVALVLSFIQTWYTIP